MSFPFPIEVSSDCPENFMFLIPADVMSAMQAAEKATAVAWFTVVETIVLLHLLGPAALTIFPNPTKRATLACSVMNSAMTNAEKAIAIAAVENRIGVIKL